MIQQDDAVRDFGVVGGNWLEGGLHSGDGREHWTQQLRLSRVNHHWQYLARRQLEHGAIILRKSILSKQARLEPSSSASFEVERGVLLGARSEIEPLSTTPAPDLGASKAPRRWSPTGEIGWSRTQEPSWSSTQETGWSPT